MAASNPILNNSGTSPWTARKVVMAVLVVITVLSGFLLLYHFREIVLLVFTGIMISISMAPAINWLYRHKIPRSLSSLIIFLALLMFLLFILLLVIPQSFQQLSKLIPVLERYYESFHALITASPYSFIHQFSEGLPATIDLNLGLNSSNTGNGSADSLKWTLNIVQMVLDGLFTFCVVLLIGFYWTLEGERVLYGFVLLFPTEKRQAAKEIIEEMAGRVGGFVTGQGLMALTIGAAAIVSYSLIGLPSIWSLGFLAGVFELVPVFGPTLGAIPAIIVALSINPTKVLWVVAATVLIQMLENHFLYPRVMQKTVGVNPIVTILAIIGFGSLFGIWGLLLAIPLAAVLQVLLDRLVLHPQKPPVEEPIGRDRISKLSYDAQEFVQDVRKRVRGKEVGIVDAESDEVEDTIESIAVDLNNMLNQVNQNQNGES